MIVDEPTQAEVDEQLAVELNAEYRAQMEKSTTVRMIGGGKVLLPKKRTNVGRPKKRAATVEAEAGTTKTKKRKTAAPATSKKRQPNQASKTSAKKQTTAKKATKQ